MAADNAMMMLDLVVDAYDIPNEAQHFLRRIINSAYEEGRLARMQEEKINNATFYGKDNDVQHIC